ncbi:MAG: PHA/PHB synthase family protein [Polaromonas sp.]
MSYLKANPLRTSSNPRLPSTDVLSEGAAKIIKAFDPFGIGKNFATLQQAWLAHPSELTDAAIQLSCELQGWLLHSWSSAMGLKGKDWVPVAGLDERFLDPEWHQNPVFSTWVQGYLLYTHWLEQTLYDTPGVSKTERRTAAFWARQWLNALAPSNFLLTNPVALKMLAESGGKSLIQGIENWQDDLKAGDLQMVDRSAFAVGKNLATTPGAVVFRNELLEVIQYTPTRDQVHALPIVIIAPWINKFYILDLTAKKSLVRFLLDQGFSVFVTSWKNPTAELSHVTFDDYMLKGALAAIETARSISEAPQVHAVGYCIGGTALAALMAWLNKEYRNDRGKIPVANWTLLTSLVDFSRPGEIEAFVNEDAISAVEAIMSGKGYLGGQELASAFRMLRPNSLIWHYFVHRYLYGESLPALNVLFWNMDYTRMPQAMHSFYLREFYLKNKLIKKNGVTLGGHTIDFSLVAQPLYAVGAHEDHIAPWRATFRTASLVRGPVRYALSTSGHIFGIINPPVHPPKCEYWAGDATHAVDAKAWRARQTKRPGSWWEDWVVWLAQHCGPLRNAPAVGSVTYRKLCAAPGTYVHEA